MYDERDPRQISTRVLDAVGRFDFSAAYAALAAAASTLDARRIALDLLPPLLTEVGDRWGSGEFCCAQEHGLSQVLRTVLGQLLIAPLPEAVRVVLVATPRGEQHEFGAMSAALLAAQAGWRPVYLGANVPFDELARACDAVHAEAVLLSAIAMPCESLDDEVSALRRSLAQSVALVLGGSCAEAHRARLASTAPVMSLGTFDRLLTERRDLRPAPSG